MIALLIAMSVDMAVAVVAAFVFGRRRWPSGVKRLGDKPVVVEFAARAGRRDPLIGPLTMDVT